MDFALSLTGADWLDLVVLALILIRCIMGAYEGISVGLATLTGLIIGGALGIWLAPKFIAWLPSFSDNRLVGTMLFISFVLFLVSGAQFICVTLVKRFRGSDRAKGWDAAAGAIVSVILVTALIWAVLTAVRPIAPRPFARAIDDSRTQQVFRALIPPQYRNLPLKAMDAFLYYLPNAFDGIEPHLPVSPPDRDSVQTAGVRRAAESVMKIRAEAPACDSDSGGSGWVVAAERVVTNAHVVAGAERIYLQVGGRGSFYEGQLVGFDPKLDLAILAVPGLTAPALVRNGEIGNGADAVAAGFPWSGDYQATPTRVRGKLEASGSDIYNNPGVKREIYAVRGSIQPGDSGGPLLDEQGEVVGTVFARSLTDYQTGYALTDAATAGWLDQASALTQPVDSGGCVVHS